MNTLFKRIDLNQPFLLLCPNQRLQKSLRYTLLKEQKTAALAQSVQALDSWLLSCFQHLQNHHARYRALHLLNPVEHALIWEALVDASEVSAQLLFKQACTDTLIQASEHCILWQVKLANYQNQHDFGKDQTLFLEWKTQFEQNCLKQGLLSPAMLLALVIEAIEADEIRFDSTIYYYGFEQANPLQQRLFATLEKHCACTRITPDATHLSVTDSGSFACQDFNEEIKYAVTWAKHIHAQDSTANVAIVVPSLNEKRQDIESTLNKILHEEKCAPNRLHAPTAYTLSSGKTLDELPLVDAALRQLDFCQSAQANKQVSVNEFIALVETPLLLQFLDFPLRKNLSLKLRDLSGDKITLKNLENLCQNNSDTHKQNWDGYFSAISKLIQTKQSLNSWSFDFMHLLRSSGWLEHQELSSFEYQAAHRFYQCIQQLSTLNIPFHQHYGLSQALRALHTLCKNEIFQVEDTEEHNKAIHVLGLLEADGQDFTHIWVCEMHDENWPPAAKPNPFLPVLLQKNLDMPHASPERELAVSKHLTQNFFKHCSNTLVFSYARQNEDKEQKLSRLLTDLTVMEKTTLSLQAQSDIPLEMKIANSKHIEYFNDDQALALAENERSRGGQSILQNQARCAFKAFASHRLKLKALQEVPNSINAMERGNLLHRLLDLIWKEIRSQKNLLALNDNALRELVAAQAHSMSSEFKNLKYSFPVAYELELERACSITFEFLQKDKNRAPFAAKEIEESMEIEIEGLQLKLRADRIDTLDDGSRLIIDYKSSIKNFNAWQTPRMDEPQLPLYLLHTESSAAIAWVFLNQNEHELGYHGLAELSEQENRFPEGIEACEKNKNFKVSWEEQKQNWEQDLKESARQFVQGVNYLNPKHSYQSCEYCEFSSMCRITDIKHQ